MQHLSRYTTFIFFLILACLFIPVHAEVSNLNHLSDLTDFLDADTTNSNEYLPWYTCGHFSRDLVHNASEQNIFLGSAIVGNHPTLRGYNNHILNYVYIQDKLIFIEPQTDELMIFHDIFYNWEYVRLYPNGDQVPTYRTGSLAPTFSYYDWGGHDKFIGRSVVKL